MGLLFLFLSYGTKIIETKYPRWRDNYTSRKIIL